MKRMKLLQVNKLYYPATGGIERTVQHIAEGLKDKVDMEVLVCQSKGRGARERLNGVPVRRCGSLGTLFSLPVSISFLWALRKRARGKDIILFHAPFPLGDLACLLSGYKGKVLLYWHSDVVKQKKLMVLYRPIMERFLRRADVIIVGADGILEGSSYLKPYRDKCVTVPFAVSDDIERRGKLYLEQVNQKPAQTGLDFLFVGRLVYYKGVDVLLKAFARVSRGKLTIIGSGELEQELNDYAVQQGISERVHFFGKASEDELCKALEACDVFILPSVARSEAFGLVQLEAMAYGKPVINTRLPSGVPEVSLDGVTGLTVEPGDVNSLVKAMEWMTGHPQERSEMGAAARLRLEKEYRLDVMMARLIEIFGKALKR